MYLTTQGLVLRVSEYNERDAIITLLTSEHGRIQAKARGLRKKNSPLLAPCQLLSLGEFTLFSYNGSYSVNEAHSIELFHGLRRDLVKLSLGTYFAQIAETVSQEDLPGTQLLSLVLNCLFVLANRDEPADKVKAVFELRCAGLAGYTPDLFSCHVCGNKYPDRFDVSAGMLECSTCRSSDSYGLRLPVSPGTLASMRYIISCHPKKLMSFDAAPEVFEQLSQITETYLSTQLERGFSTLDFYKSLLLPR